LYGGFKIDPTTGAQTKHETVGSVTRTVFPALLSVGFIDALEYPFDGGAGGDR
jgi:hypothetical protein